MPKFVYLVVEVDSGNSYQTQRVYTSREQAEAFVAAYNATDSGYCEVEEILLGAPEAEYDGPIWIGTWSAGRKLIGEKQLVIVADGFTTVIPSAMPSYDGWQMGPSWQDLSILSGSAPEYEEPPVWIDNFRYRKHWHTGDEPTSATITARVDNFLEVRGTSRDDVEALLRETAHEVKAEL